MKLNELTIGLLLLFLSSSVSSAKKTEILDLDGDSSSVEFIAQAVCDITRGTDRQISRYSTVDRLIQFFRSLDSSHRLAACGQQSLPALEQMQLILSVGDEDVCGETKIKMMEKFHRNFISKVRKYKKEQKASNLSAPKVIKLFYLHYVSAVSATCERAAIKDLQTITVDETESEDADIVLHPVSSLFGKFDANRGYRDMFLLWNFIESLPLEKDAKLSRYLHQGSTRLVLQMKDVNSLAKMQDGCREARLFYSHSLLPVIRLADLGFYPESKQLALMLSSNPKYSYWYTVTQLCETFLGLKAVPNDSLEAGQIVVLSKDETAALDIDKDLHDDLVNSGSGAGSESLKSVLNDHSQAFIRKVKANVNSRVSEQNKILKLLIRRFKGESKGQAGQFVLSDGSTKEDFESILHESLPNIDASNPLGPIESDQQGAEDVAIRKKRGAISFVKNTLKFIVLMFACLVYFGVWWILFFVKVFILIPVKYILSFITNVTGARLEKFKSLVNRGIKYKLPLDP